MKKILRNMLNGLKFFPIGVMFLVLSYVMVYYIDGQKMYLIELAKLVSVDVLIYEIFVSGIWFAIVGVLIGFFQDMEFEKNKIKLKNLINIIIAIFIFGIFEIIVECNSKLQTGFDSEVGIIFIGFVLVSLICMAILYIIYKSIEDVKLKKALNQKKDELK